MDDKVKEIEKVEEAPVYEKIEYESGEIVFVPHYDLNANIFEINKWTVVQYQENGGVLVLEGLVTMPGAHQKQKAKYNINIFQTRVFKDFEKAKHYLAQELSRVAIKISKGLKVLENIKEPETV